MSSVAPKVSVSLFSFDGVGLIVPWKTGVTYSTQAGGAMCCQVAEEGFFVPLDQYSCPVVGIAGTYLDMVEEFHKLISIPCRVNIHEEEADLLDGLFMKSLRYSGILVDRSRLVDSMEAWVHVIITRQTEFGNIQGDLHLPLKAILVWPSRRG